MSSSKLTLNNAASAVAAVARFARRRVRSTAEVRAYLRRRGVSDVTAEHVLAACRARSLLDDPAAARLWAEQWARAGYAWSVIREKLTAKGFDEAVLERLERTVGTVAEDAARARGLITRDVQQPPHRNTAQERARLARRLTARGFDPELIESLLTDER